MGIEPTRDFVEPRAGFEDQERHQAAAHLRAGPPRRLPEAGVFHFRRAVSCRHGDRLKQGFQRE